MSSATHNNTLQHTATHCKALQHTATHCNTLQHNSASVNAKEVDTKWSRHRGWARDVIKAVAGLHKLGIIHGSLSLDVVHIDSKSQIKISGFHSATRRQVDATFAQVGQEREREKMKRQAREREREAGATR